MTFETQQVAGDLQDWLLRAAKGPELGTINVALQASAVADGGRVVLKLTEGDSIDVVAAKLNAGALLVS